MPYRKLRGVFVALVVLGLGRTAQAQPGNVVVGRPPPTTVYEPVPRRPSAVSVWADGYWAWDGASYHWVPGRWLVRPRPGVVWRTARWIPEGGRHRFVAGAWVRHSPRAHLRLGHPVEHAPPPRILVRRYRHRHGR